MKILFKQFCKFKPLDTFQNYVKPQLMQVLRKNQWITPTQIQAKGQNIIGISKTGSGKTLAFLLNQINSILGKPKKNKNQSPYMLIIQPTRQLCKQTANVSQLLTSKLNYRTHFIHGGEGRQILSKLRQGTQILVSTPGILLDSLQNKIININDLQTLVIDQADYLLQIGFFQTLKKIASHAKNIQKVQRLFFSATWNKQVQQLSKDIFHMKQFQNITIAQDKPIIQQSVCIVQQNKRQVLLKFLKNTKAKIIIVCQKIHGDIPQQNRNYEMNKFRSKQNGILFASNVMARGIDVKDIQYVINYNCPSNIQQYTHRIGRTGRAGKKGKSITLIDKYQQLNNFGKNLKERTKKIII